MLMLLRGQFLCALIFLLNPIHVQAEKKEGNQTITSFKTAKRLLMKKVYNERRTTLYCNAPFHQDKSIDLPEGFKATQHKKRSHRVEFEHVVPAENFGRNFTAWREGNKLCVHAKSGQSFKGRKCAQKVNKIYQLIYPR